MVVGWAVHPDLRGKLDCRYLDGRAYAGRLFHSQETSGRQLAQTPSLDQWYHACSQESAGVRACSDGPNHVDPTYHRAGRSDYLGWFVAPGFYRKMEPAIADREGCAGAKRN